MLHQVEIKLQQFVPLNQKRVQFAASNFGRCLRFFPRFISVHQNKTPDRYSIVIYANSFQTGMITKNVVNKQRILIKNTKRVEPITITLHESIPKSTDGRIQVRLRSPEVFQVSKTKLSTQQIEDVSPESPAVGAMLDDSHNLIWVQKIEAETEMEFLVDWSVQYPSDKVISYCEEFEKE